MPSFRPSAHGWPFPDDYDCPAALIGLGRPVAPEFGLAGGMCWAALDRFHAGRRISRTVRAPGPEDATYAEFVLRLTNVLGKDVVARAARVQRLPETGRGRSLASVSRAEWAIARREMDSGRPVLLLLLRDIGPFADPTAARFVLATRYDADPTRAMVWTYDPRRPGDDAATLTLDPGKGSEPFVGRMGREETVRGVIAVPYDRAAPPAIVASSSPKDERRRVGLEEDLAEFDAGPNALGLLARDTEAHLVCIRHDDGGWSRERPADLGDVGADFRFEGAPYPAGGSGDRPSAVVRGVNGHLLHLRRGSRGWIAEDLTDQPNTGLRFRLEGDPVVLAEGRHPVVAGVNGDGRLLRYAWTTVRGWAAENLSKESGADPGCRLVGPICGLRDGSGLAHVLGRNADGELVHFREEADGRWRAARPAAARAELRKLLLDGPPVAELAADGGIEAFARGVGDHLLRFRLPAGGRWTGQDLTEDAGGGAPALTIAARPCLAGSAAGLRHVLGRNADGDVVHFFGAPDGTWGAENLTTDRITIGAQFRVEGQPAAAAAGSTVLLAARRGAELVLYRWHGSDWRAENLTIERGVKDDGPRVASDPLIARAAQAAHIVALSSGGTVVHYRVETPMAGRRAAPGSVTSIGGLVAAAGGIADTMGAFVSGILDRFRKPRKAVGLRASPVRSVEDAGAPDAAEEDSSPSLVERLATVGSDDDDDRDVAHPDPGVDVPGGHDAGREAGDPERPWGRPTSAAAPWHEGEGEDAGDAASAGAGPGGQARGPSTTGDPERDLLREGSGWSGPRLLPETAPAPEPAADDWDIALRDVAAAHERELVGDSREEVVDEEDHAAARIFLAADRPAASVRAGSADGTASSAAEVPTPPLAAEAPAPSPAAVPPRQSSTDSVPGRPLVDLSFLSDIVRSDEGSAAASSPGAPAGGASQPPPEDPAPKSAAASASAAAPARPRTEPTPPAIARPLAPRRGVEPGADEATRRAAGGGARRAADGGTAGARNAAASPGANGAPATAGEPVVDLDFLETAAEYVGGGDPSRGLGAFLQFLEHG